MQDKLNGDKYTTENENSLEDMLNKVQDVENKRRS